VAMTLMLFIFRSTIVLVLRLRTSGAPTVVFTPSRAPDARKSHAQGIKVQEQLPVNIKRSSKGLEWKLITRVTSAGVVIVLGYEVSIIDMIAA